MALPRVLVMGAGFAGVECPHRLERTLRPSEAELVLASPHVIAQLNAAAVATDPEERAGRPRFVVVGGGYAGTETAAGLQLPTRAAAARFPRLAPSQRPWHLVDIPPPCCPRSAPG